MELDGNLDRDLDGTRTEQPRDLDSNGDLNRNIDRYGDLNGNGGWPGLSPGSEDLNGNGDLDSNLVL